MPRGPSEAGTRARAAAPAASVTDGGAASASGATRQDAETSALFESCYAELRSLADAYFKRKSRNDTLQPTALVHEVYVRLARSSSVVIRDREHFLALAATAMRQILIDRERGRRSRKRDGGTQITITRDLIPDQGDQDAIVDVLTLDAALRTLAEVSPRQAHLVEMRYFGGLTVDETAAVLDVSVSFAEKEWRVARAWLRRELASSFG
jgi:RNA polymerase sigma factor (TIGR02999 family)